jgi:vancomycin resistance protein YoaR
MRVETAKTMATQQEQAIPVNTSPVANASTNKPVASVPTKEELVASFKVILPNEVGTTNAGVAADIINGHIIKVGEIFSFNQVVGERTADKGFIPGTLPYHDKDGKVVIVREVGSGVCRESDLMATLARIAKLDQIEINKHDITPGYFAKNPGLADATVYWDENLDNRFQNNQDFPIKIKTWLDKNTFILYGEFYKLY